MMMLSRCAAAIALASLLLTSAAVAQTTAPAPKTDAPAAETRPAAPPPLEKRATRQRAPGSVECSREADAKGLKGKERRKFRRECKKAAAEKSAGEK